MADDFGVTPKQNFQLDWSRGITDGDIGPGFVRELINLEMDKPGVLRTRDVLRYGGSADNVGALDAVVIRTMYNDPVNPTASSEYTYIAVGGTYGTGRIPFVTFMEESDQSVAFTVTATEALGTTWSDDSGSLRMEKYGDVIYMCFSDAQGDPLKTFVLYRTSDDSFLRRPKYFDAGESDWEDFDHMVEGANDWVLKPLDVAKPVFTGVEIGHRFSPEGEDDDIGIGPFEMNRKFDEVSDYLQGDVDVVMMYKIETNGTTDLECILPYEIEFEYFVQFEYLDGSLSPISDKLQIYSDISDPWPTGFQAISFTIAINPEAAVGMKSVLVYRRIVKGVDGTGQVLDEEDEPRLIMTAAVATSIIETYDEQITWSEGWGQEGNQYDYGFVGHVRYANHEQIETADCAYTAGGDYPFDAAGDGSSLIAGESRYEHGVPFAYGCTGVAAYRTVGWREWDEHTAIFMPDHIGFHANEVDVIPYVRNIGSDVGPYWPTVGPAIKLTNAIVVGSYFGSTVLPETGVPVGCVAAYGDVVLDMPSGSDNNQTSVEFPSIYDFTGGFVESFTRTLVSYRALFDSTLETYDTELCVIGTVGVLSWDMVADIGIADMAHPGITEDSSNNNPNFYGKTTLVTKRDNGQALPSTFSSINNMTIDEHVPVESVDIAVVGGRMFRANVEADGDRFKHRLMYSAFRRFNIYSKNSYIDFKDQTSDALVAIVPYENFLLAFSTRACTVIDISSGSDMGWREHAVYDGVGIKNKRSVKVTPFGVAWANFDGVYFFSAQGFREIGDEIKVRLKAAATYAGYPVMMYNSSMKQLWMHYTEDLILVMNILTGAWHTHKLTEVAYGSLLDLVFTGSNNTMGGGYVRDVMITRNSSWPTTRTYKYDIIAISPDITGLENPPGWEIDLGDVHLGAPEIVKKFKRFYIHMVNSNSSDITVEFAASGDKGGSISSDFDVTAETDDFVKRISASTRGYKIAVRFYTNDDSFGGEPCDMEIDSIGASYKAKRIK